VNPSQIKAGYERAGDSRPPTYFTVSDRNYFLGTVALINSLRVTGNRGDFVVLDAGLSDAQRLLLGDHAKVMDPPEECVHPFLLKPYPHFSDSAGTAVLIDSDVIVTGSLTEILWAAERGFICAYPDGPETRTRWFQEWQTRLGLRAPLRRDVCVNSGFLAIDMRRWSNLLTRWWEACQLIPPNEILVPGPFYSPDQDALNALLMSEFPREQLYVLPQFEAGIGVTVGAAVNVDSLSTLECTLDGHQTKILHFIDRPKPWEKSGWTRLAASDYVRLMRRLLFSDDVAIQLAPNQAPLWLRPSERGELTLKALGAANRAILAALRCMPSPLSGRLRRMRRAIACAITATHGVR
jgi:hypothetical protein